MKLYHREVKHKKLSKGDRPVIPTEKLRDELCVLCG